MLSNQLSTLAFVTIVLLLDTLPFVFSFQSGGVTETPGARSTALASLMTKAFGGISLVEEASRVLSKWDEHYFGMIWSSSRQTSNTVEATKNNLYRLLPDAVRYLNFVASEERAATGFKKGRCVLGICASSADKGIGALKLWVSELDLPRGLLFGMDNNGVPLEKKGGVYLKYNSAVGRRQHNRKADEDENTAAGAQQKQRPGDVVLSLYVGKYRGVYFQVELRDNVFRQYMLPSNIFTPKTNQPSVAAA